MKKLQVLGLALTFGVGFLASASLCAANISKAPLPMSASPGQGFSQDGLKKIDTFFADQIANNQLPGAVLAVAKNGKLVIYKPYGYTDKQIISR